MPTRTQANSYPIPTRIQANCIELLLLCNVSYKQEHSTCLPFGHDSFASELRQSELVLYPPSDVTELAGCYDETKTTLLDKFVPLQKVRSKARPSAPWFDADCRCSKAKTSKLEKAYRKKPSNQSRFWYRFTFMTNSNGNNSMPWMAYAAVRTTKEDDNVVFSFLRRQLLTSDQAEAFKLKRRSSFCARRRRSFYAANSKETQEGNVKCPSSRTDTNSQCPTHIQALSDEQSWPSN